MSCSCLVLRIQYPWMDPVGEYLCLQLIDGWGLTRLTPLLFCRRFASASNIITLALFCVSHSLWSASRPLFSSPISFFLLPRSSRLPFTLPPMSAEEQHPLEHGTSQRRSVGDEMASATSRVGWERGPVPSADGGSVCTTNAQEARPVRPAVSAY